MSYTSAMSPAIITATFTATITYHFPTPKTSKSISQTATLTGVAGHPITGYSASAEAAAEAAAAEVEAGTPFTMEIWVAIDVLSDAIVVDTKGKSLESDGYSEGEKISEPLEEEKET
ncbi:hypothetical protein OIDMADRAFT_34559 [Oidiodendron maius Zn]|uniref:Uncharacterized protein n=1 Tax=Oidiodendron maius (strain Zn) TaxID=913774 RepID=A0A0C3GT07_OIDMZ|nr:hypothetical protein OIDMADRAFT_34559 [Oidiodendron maius Zn]